MRARAGLLACFFIVLVSCERRQPLEKRPGCRTPEVVECLQPYSSRMLDSDEIRLLIEEACLAVWRRPIQSDCRSNRPVSPLEMGKDERNGLPVILVYTCNDLCPAYGGLRLLSGRQS